MTSCLPATALLLVSCAFIVSSALPIHYSCPTTNGRSSWTLRPHHQQQFRYHPSTTLYSTKDEEKTDDESLLAEVDISTLQNLCSQYSLSTSGSKQELLSRLRDFANIQAEKDRLRREGRKERVENNLEGKARHTFVDEPWSEEEDEESGGYFYFDAGETEEEKKKREEQEKKAKMDAKKKQARKTSQTMTVPNIEDVEPNEKGERVVTIYSTTDKNDLTGMQTPSMSMDEMGQKPLGSNMPEDSLIGGPFGDTTGSKRKKVDEKELEEAKESLRQLVGDLLATTGAPAFQDDFTEEEESEVNSFTTPYGFVGFNSERIPPETLVDSSFIMRIQNGKALHEVLEEYELQAIGYDGMAADDREKGGGHYREVEKVRSFLEAFRKSEDRRVARETSTMLLDKLVKEGVAGLDQMLASMPKEGDDASHMLRGEAGVLNSALIRYLEEAIREQEQRVERIQTRRNNDLPDADDQLEEDNNEIMWNVTRGEDGTTIETIDLNDPAVRDQLAKAQDQLTQDKGNNLSSLTVQEKMLLLLKLLRDRVKVEAIMGSNAQTKNLRILAYCLKCESAEEKRKFILNELGCSLDVSILYSFFRTSFPNTHLIFCLCIVGA